MRIRLEMVKAMSITESFMYTAGQIFGTKESGVKEIDTIDEMKSFADMINNAS